jgi:hypothetical protein
LYYYIPITCWSFKMVKLFRRRQDDTQVSEELPEEVQEYYEAGRRERTGVAWLLAFVTLLITIVVALSAFWGGRWVYRKIADRGNSPEVTTTQNADNEPNADNKPATPPTDQNQPSNNTPATNPQSSTQSPQPSTPSTTPTTGPSETTEDLPNTGPASNLAIFVVASVVGMGLYELSLRRKLN